MPDADVRAPENNDDVEHPADKLQVGGCGIDVEHLKRFTKKLIITYDGDKAGQAAIAKALEELGDLPVQIVQIPDAMDPDEYLQKNSPEDLAYLLSNTHQGPLHLESEQFELVNHQVPLEL